MRNKIRTFLLTACVAMPITLIAQDERFLRQLFTGSLKKSEEKVAPAAVHYKVRTPFYEFDFNGDLRNEKIIVEKLDAQTWIHVHAYNRERVFSHKFNVNGVNSDLYRIQVRNLSPTTRVFVLYFYEGKTEYVDFSGSARVYFMTIDNNDLKTLAVKKGPAVWEEVKVGTSHYHQRNYNLSLFDYNRDGVNEITVKYHLSSKVYFYKGKGKWLRN